MNSSFICAVCGIPASIDPRAGQYAHDYGSPHDHHPVVAGSDNKWNRDVCRRQGCEKPIYRDFKCIQHGCGCRPGPGNSVLTCAQHSQIP